MRPLRTVTADLRVLTDYLSTTWAIGIKRTTQKRAQGASLAILLREIVVILDRLVSAFSQMQMVNDERRGLEGSHLENDPYRNDLVLIQMAISPQIEVDIKSLYHWAFTLYDFMKQHADSHLDLRELQRIVIFRNKMVVHFSGDPNGPTRACRRWWTGLGCGC